MKLSNILSSIKSRSSSAASSPSPSPRSPSLSPKSFSNLFPTSRAASTASSPRLPSLSPNLIPSPRRMQSSQITKESTSKIPQNLRREFELVFREFDANGDGKISAAELRAILRSLGDKLTEEEAIRMVKEVDADGDGYIDLEEFIDMNRKFVNESTGEIASLDELKAAFHVFDTDRNGFITPQELHAVLNNLGDKKCTLDDCSKMIMGVDRNDDGCVDFDEFRLMMTNVC